MTVTLSGSYLKPKNVSMVSAACLSGDSITMMFLLLSAQDRRLGEAAAAAQVPASARKERRER